MKLEYPTQIGDLARKSGMQLPRDNGGHNKAGSASST